MKLIFTQNELRIAINIFFLSLVRNIFSDLLYIWRPINFDHWFVDYISTNCDFNRLMPNIAFDVSNPVAPD